MAARVVKGGFETFTTFHRRREPADALAALGASIVATPAEVARASDLVITVLPADAELRQTVLGANGLRDGLAPGKVLVDMTTATAMAVREVEESLREVSGGTTGAEQGTLTIMVGGDADLLDQCRPVLETMGTRIVHVGPVGQGKVVKMVNQMMAATNLLIMGEAFALGVRCGADPATLYSVIKDSSGYSRMLDVRMPDFLMKGFFEPGFKLDLMKKDVNIALDSARAMGTPVLLASTVAQVFAAASAAGKGDADFSAAAQFLVDMAQATLQVEKDKRS